MASFFRMTSSPLLLASIALLAPHAAIAAEYGVDVSYPMHSAEVPTDGPLGDRQTIYQNLINGCQEEYGKKGFRCWQNEQDRIEMSLRQPQSMVNYTKMGFTKIRAPDEVYSLLKEFWDHNRDRAKKESWPVGNTYVNHWDRTSKIVSVEDPDLKYAGRVLKQKVWDAARSTIQEWTGQRLAECSLYGIRIYEEGAVLATHVDRLPLVSSAIINVDQDVDEPWPLEVIGHDGKAYNVTMEPGDLVLYESHSILHGRPFPLKGRFMANIFVHFEPVGKLGEPSIPEGDLPPYVIPGSPQEPVWRAENPDGWKLMAKEEFTTGATEAHRLAVQGNFGLLTKALEAAPELANAKDVNEWTPLHEAVRGGTSEAIIELLVENGANINAKIDSGFTALDLAHQYHGKNHPIVQALNSLGAKLGPEL